MPAPTDQALEREIVALLGSREGSICPSDVARALGTADEWRGLMPDVRAAAQRLAGRGEVMVTQGDRTVPDAERATGPLRIRRGPSFPDHPVGS